MKTRDACRNPLNIKRSVYIESRESIVSRALAARSGALPPLGSARRRRRPCESAAGFSPIAPLVEAAIARHELPGAVVLVGRGDAVVYRRAFGQRAVAPAPEPMTEDTIFDVASLTKVVATTTSVMKLVEEGRIRLNDPVAHVHPGVRPVRQERHHHPAPADAHVRAAARPRARSRVPRRGRSDPPRRRGSADGAARRAIHLQRHQLLSARRHRPPRQRRAARSLRARRRSSIRSA